MKFDIQEYGENDFEGPTALSFGVVLHAIKNCYYMGLFFQKLALLYL